MTINRIRLGIVSVAITALIVCLSAVAGHTQTYTQGAMGGTVFDPSGAVLPGAIITIHNDGTNAETHLVADSSGYFKAAQLPASVYTVTVTAPGFAPFKEVNVIVQVGLTSDVSPHLRPAGSIATVEVTGEAPILNFESPDMSTVLNTKSIQDLPLNGGRWSDMTLLTPAAVGDSNGFGLIAFRGISPILNNIEIDGADDNQAYYSEERGRTREGYSTSKYMIQEFQVNTGVYSAEFGRAAGGVINAVTKSGSNNIHGIAYLSDRDNTWGAYNPFTTNTVNAGTATSPSFLTSPYKPKDWRKEWGFDAGGPLMKNRLFWFYGYAQYRRNFPGTGKAASPGAFFVLPDSTLPSGYTCNFANIKDSAGKITSGKGYVSAPVNGAAASTVDQMACTLAARMGYSTYDAGATAYSMQLTNLLSDLGPVNRTGDEVLNTPKLDWRINDKQTLSFLFHRLRWDSPGGVQTQATNNYAVDGFGNDYVKLDYGLTKLDSLITSNLANEIRYQFGRELNYESQQPLSGYTKKYLQGNNGVTATGAGGFSPNIPQVNLLTSTTGFYLGSLYYGYRKALPDEHKWQVGDTATWQLGRHGIKFGVDMIHNYDLLNNTYESNGVYSYSYIGNYFADLLNEGKSTGVCNSTGSVTAPGTSTADYTGGAPCGTFVQGFGTTTWDINTMDYGFFVEDHWKLSPHITVDMGIRYDYESLPAPYSNLITGSGAFVPYLASTGGLCALYDSSRPGTCPALAKAANISNHPSDKNNIGPRLGIAWDPWGVGQTTIRAGYGLYYGRVTNGALLNNLLNTGSPNGQFVSSSFSPNSANAPLFPNIVASAGFSTPTSYFFANNFQNPQVHEFDVSIQQAVGHGTIFQLSYMGALGRELPNALNINLNPNANTVTTAATAPNGVIQSYIQVSDSTGKGPLKNGTVFVVPTYSKGATTTSNLLNPNYGAVNELMSNINSSYHAMVAEVVNKTSKLIQYDVNYTWSHALDFNQNAATTTLGNGWFDPYNIDGYAKGANYGNSNFDVRNRVVAWTLINSPEIQANGWLKQLANHWSLNPVFQAQNGLPYSATIGQGSPSISAYSSSWNGAGSNYWIPAIGRNTYQLPRTMVLDVRLEKQFEINVKDRAYHLQLLGEFFNVANHMNVTGISNTAYNLSANSGTTSLCGSAGSTFGAVSGQAQAECSTLTFVPKVGAGTGASGFQAVSNADSNFAYSPRQVQLSLRLDF